jgi:ABC-type uncharacterized transport system substrate-binding protein
MRLIGLVLLALSLTLAPLAAEAQQTGKVYRISFLALLPSEDLTLMEGLKERLHELGYIEGRNLIFEYRSAEGRQERVTELATTTIPIVFASVGDPVGAGVVASLGRPGGNVTGVTGQSADLAPKRLQLLRDLLPSSRIIAVLANPATPFAQLALKETKEAADLHRPLTTEIRRQIADLATKFRLPTIYTYREFVEAGGLISYGPSQRDMYRRTAEYADRILKGAKPADLPVEQPTKFQLVINLKTAKAIGLTIPQSLLVRADQVIK